MLGSGMSGLIFDLYSAHELYLISALLCMVSVSLTLSASMIEKKKLKSQERENVK